MDTPVLRTRVYTAITRHEVTQTNLKDQNIGHPGPKNQGSTDIIILINIMYVYLKWIQRIDFDNDCLNQCIK